MKISDILKSEGVASFAAAPLKGLNITKEYLISDAAADELYAVMMVLPYPASVGSRFAAFARIADYHNVFVRRIFGKLSECDAFKNKYMKVFADHSPIDERDAAARAGLGVIGDNGLFISEKYGSFVFLGEIICSLSEEELAENGIAVRCGEANGCIHCGACREKCPAGCIGGDKALCVSNLTQKKGHLSDIECDIIKTSGYVWGCDICALVCPMNRTAQTPLYNECFLKAEDFKTYGDIERLTDEEYASFAFSWRKKEVLKRNFGLFANASEGETQ